VAAVTATLFYPLFASVVKGQDSALAALGVLLWGYFLSRGRERASGLSLALLLAKPHFAIALAVPTFFASRKAFAWFCAVGMAAVILTLAFIGFEGARGMVELLRLSAESNDYGISRTEQVNLLGLMLRAGVGVTVAKASAWLAFASAICYSAWLMHKGCDLSRLGVVVALSVITSPHLHSHDLSLLLLPMCAAASKTKHRALAFLPLSPAYMINRIVPYLLTTLLCLILRRRSGR